MLLFLTTCAGQAWQALCLLARPLACTPRVLLQSLAASRQQQPLRDSACGEETSAAQLLMRPRVPHRPMRFDLSATIPLSPPVTPPADRDVKGNQLQPLASVRGSASSLCLFKHPQ